jgi:hypothetical protein
MSNYTCDKEGYKTIEEVKVRVISLNKRGKHHHSYYLCEKCGSYHMHTTTKIKKRISVQIKESKNIKLITKRWNEKKRS